jgi:short-subunit dehydrogenase
VKAAGRTFLVTGASSGIGAALALMLADQGATVGVVARRADRLEEVLRDCQASSPDSRMWVADLGDTERAEGVAREAADAFGGVDVLVNNAGVPKRRHATKLSFDELDYVMRVNFMAPARMTMALLPAWVQRGEGWVVNVSSLAGRLGNANESAYSASKFALCGWSEALAVDLWDTGVKVRLVNPGPIDTEIWDLPGEDEPLYHGDKVPAEEVAAGIIAALDSDEFEHYLPDMKAVVDMKQGDIDTFLAGMADMVKQGGPRLSGGERDGGAR